ncbi:MAG: hypothetical protein WD382_01415 [Halofilum sp. (in: g-proteobacteria)]
MDPTTWIAVAASFSAFASFAAAWAAINSNQIARRSHDVQRWSVHGANVHATVGWGPDQYTFELTVRNDGPGVAYGVHAEVAPATGNFSGVLPKIETSWQDRFDLAPADQRVLTEEWRQHSDRWLKVGLHWTERADDGVERTPPIRWMTVYRENPPSVPMRE